MTPHHKTIQKLTPISRLRWQCTSKPSDVNDCGFRIQYRPYRISGRTIEQDYAAYLKQRA